MVGVQDVRSCTMEEMSWLENGGANKILARIREFNKNPDVDFSVWFVLPTDKCVHLKGAKGIAERVWILHKTDHHKVPRLMREITRYLSKGDILYINSGAEEWDLKDNEYMIDTTWHGDESYCRGWNYVLKIVPEGLFRDGI